MTLRFALTPGEPAGIGPDLAVMYCQQASEHELVAFADPQLLNSRACQLGLPLTLRTVDLSQTPKPLAAGELGVVAVPLAEPSQASILNPANAPYVLQCLDQAINACLASDCQGMITGPVQKSVINDAGIPFSGHTEYLEKSVLENKVLEARELESKKLEDGELEKKIPPVKTADGGVVMMLATAGLKVALATTHLPLKDVAAAITKETLTRVITLLHRDLQQKFGLSTPRILICGLNPHAGEGGHLGREEIEIIIPTLATLKQQGIECIGPLPADTLFTPKYLNDADAVLAMYHDQGLPVLKYKGFGQAANITLGLPIIRTSVDHGTALDLAGSGNIDTGSLQTAIEYAVMMAQASENQR